MVRPRVSIKGKTVPFLYDVESQSFVPGQSFGTVTANLFHISRIAREECAVQYTSGNGYCRRAKYAAVEAEADANRSNSGDFQGIWAGDRGFAGR